MATPQQKILHVAKSLGITDMKYMQGTTRVLYHSQNPTTGAGANPPNYTFFGDALNNAAWIANTNVPTGSKLQVNEALLVEKIQFNYVQPNNENNYTSRVVNGGIFGYEAVVDLYIGNKRVLKDVRLNTEQLFMDFTSVAFQQTCELFLEGVGILIPPQVEFYLQVRFLNANTNAPLDAAFAAAFDGDFMCSLYGTGVLLNLNTTL